MLVSARALTVFVVAHNDSQKLLATIDRIYNALTVTVEDFSILIFDDGSTDDTLVVAKAASEKYPFVDVRRNERRMGPGYCTIAGSRDASTHSSSMLPPITLGRSVPSSNCSAISVRPTL